MTMNIFGRISLAEDNLTQGLYLHRREQHGRCAGELKCEKVSMLVHGCANYISHWLKHLKSLDFTQCT